MRRIKRAVHVDFHTMPGIGDFNSRFDADKFAQTLKDAHVEYVNVFARCNEGFAYYPTKIGVPYEGMKIDMLGETVRACHERGIGVTAYMNASYDQEHAIRHREWTIKNPAIQRSDDWVYDYFIDMCYYNSGYKDYLIGMVKEVCENYDVDGIFIDCMGKNTCYCDACLRSMRKKGLDINDPEAVKKHSEDSQRRFCEDVKAAVGPDKHLFFNMMYWGAKGCNTHIEIEGLPGGQGYDFFLPQVSYARNIENELLYMTARFQKSWADFGGLKSYEAMEYDVWDAFMNCCDVSVGDHMHPAESLEPHVYDMIGRVYAEVIKYEPYTEGAKYVPEVGILTGSDCFIDKSGRGAVRILSELKYNFDIVNEDMDLSRFALLILPDNITVTDKLSAKLREHIKAGKGIIASAKSGLNAEQNAFAMPEWGVSYECDDPSNQPYFKMRNTENPIIGDVRYAMYDTGILMNADEGTQVLADYIKPYFNRHRDAERGYFYTPPMAPDGHPAITRCGNVYHISFKMFETYYTGGMLAHKEIVSDMLKALIKTPLIKAEALPRTARATLTRNSDFDLLHVKVDYPEIHGEAQVIESHNALPAGRKISVRGEYVSVSTAPCEAPVLFTVNDGYTEITLPEITGYVMLVLRK